MFNGSKNFVIQDLAKDKLPDNSLKDVIIVSFISSTSRINLTDTLLLTLFQINSIGFKSGEYGGKNTKLIPRSHA